MGVRDRMDYSVYVVVDRRFARGGRLEEIVRAALRGGATVIQLREKEAGIREMIEMGRRLRDICHSFGVPFIVNDRVDVALAVDADGVHVGPEDMPPEIARRLIGPDRILGVSATSVDEALQGERAGADYLGVGDVFGTRTKPDAGKPIGPNGLAEIVRRVRVPVVAIGGVTAENAGEAVRAGAAGVAVISAVVSAPDPEEATRRLVRAVAEAKRARS